MPPLLQKLPTPELSPRTAGNSAIQLVQRFPEPAHSHCQYLRGRSTLATPHKPMILRELEDSKSSHRFADQFAFVMHNTLRQSIRLTWAA